MSTESNEAGRFTREGDEALRVKLKEAEVLIRARQDRQLLWAAELLVDTLRQELSGSDSAECVGHLDSNDAIERIECELRDYRKRLETLRELRPGAEFEHVPF